MTCEGRAVVSTRRYTDVFYGLDGKAFPGFNDLLHRVTVPSNGETKQLPEDVAKLVAMQLAPIYQVCRNCHFKPLLSEFALISDTRGIGPDTDPFFSSYISVFLNAAIDLAQAYADALRYMATPEAGKVQIVPHPELFECITASVQARCGLFAEAESHGMAAPTKDPVYIVGLRQRFQLLQDPGLKLEQRVQVFLQTFFKKLRSYPCLTAAAEQLARSEFLLLPFVRPGYASAALPDRGTSEREQFRSYPGGALFLFLEPDNPPKNEKQLEKDLDELSRALSWLMAESSLRESYNSLQVEENRKRNSISYGVTHPLKSRLTTLTTNTELLMRSYQRKESDFEDRLKFHFHRVQTVHWFAHLAHMLHYVATHGAAETLSAQEHNGELRFSAVGELDLKEVLVDEASNISIDLTWSGAVHPIVAGFANAERISEPVRLQDNLYREIIYELLANVGRHTDLNHAAVDMCDIEGTLALVLTNRVEERTAKMGSGEPVNGWTKWDSPSPRGLSFVKSALSSTRAGEVFYKGLSAGISKNPHSTRLS